MARTMPANDSHPGSDPPWVVPFVKAVVLSADRRCFLLQHRIKPGDLYEGFWELPGGRVQAGESLRACLEREVLEETGLPIAEVLGQTADRLTDRLGGSARLVRPLVTIEVDEHSIFGHYFACVARADAAPRSSPEGDRHRWITPAAFRQAFLDPLDARSRTQAAARQPQDPPGRVHASVDAPGSGECSTVDLLALRVAFADGLERFFRS